MPLLSAGAFLHIKRGITKVIPLSACQKSLAEFAAWGGK